MVVLIGDDSKIFPDLSLAKDFFNEITAEKGDCSNLKLRLDSMICWIRVLNVLEASIVRFYYSEL